MHNRFPKELKRIIKFSNVQCRKGIKLLITIQKIGLQGKIDKWYMKHYGNIKGQFDNNPFVFGC